MSVDTDSFRPVTDHCDLTTNCLRLVCIHHCKSIKTHMSGATGNLFTYQLDTILDARGCRFEYRMKNYKMSI